MSTQFKELPTNLIIWIHRELSFFSIRNFTKKILLLINHLNLNLNLIQLEHLPHLRVFQSLLQSKKMMTNSIWIN